MRGSGRRPRGLCRLWAALDGDAELVIEDDRSDSGMLQALLPKVATGCDVLLGPYSTQLARVAGKMAAGAGWLVWNHGGSGDDVQAACPGHAVSLLTPASRYAERFIRDVVDGTGLELWIGQGKGSFGRQVADGAQKIAEQAGICTRRLGTVIHGRAHRGPGRWCPRARSRTTCRRSTAPGASQTRPG
jgi:hypothetical protein